LVLIINTTITVIPKCIPNRDFGGNYPKKYGHQKKMIFDHGYEPQRKLWEKFISFAALTDVEGEEQ
jgi:hypothetical protein